MSDAPREILLITYGPPRTKKNSGRIVTAGRGSGGRRRVLPSAAWAAWCEKALLDLAKQKRHIRESFPLLQPYNVTALFYRDARRGDAVGYYQALADVLEKAGVVADDAQLVSWDGSRLLKDSARPRVEITLTPVDS